jgi:hypothetical protein
MHHQGYSALHPAILAAGEELNQFKNQTVKSETNSCHKITRPVPSKDVGALQGGVGSGSRSAPSQLCQWEGKKKSNALCSAPTNGKKPHVARRWIAKQCPLGLS